jgi:hypothetical protein
MQNISVLLTHDNIATQEYDDLNLMPYVELNKVTHLNIGESASHFNWYVARINGELKHFLGGWTVDFNGFMVAQL